MSEKKETSLFDEIIKEAGERGFTIVLGKDLRINVGKSRDVSIDIGKKKDTALHIELGPGKAPSVSFSDTDISHKKPQYENERMKNLTILKEHMEHTDEEVFGALCYIDGKKLKDSPVARLEDGRGKKLFCSVWRYMCGCYKEGNRDFFTLVFGKPRRYSWYSWYSFDKERFEAFVHETERQLRAYLKAGRALKEKETERWISPYVKAVIEADRKEKQEASRPVVNIDAEGLAKIREDAEVTRDWLLTEEDTAEDAEVPEETGKERAVSSQGSGDICLEVLQMILDGEAPEEYLKSRGMMPSVAADMINEAFYGEIGDSVLEWDGNGLRIVEDYREDIEGILRGKEDE